MSATLFDLCLALRNVQRHQRRSAMAIAAVAFGVAALLIAGGFIEWLFLDMRENTIRSQLGHVQVMRTGYLESGAADPFSYLMPDSAGLSRIRAAPHVKAVGPRIGFSGLISHGEASLAFLGQGVAPDQESELSSNLKITAGQNLSAADNREIILGEGLADNLGVKVGDTVVLLVNSATGGPNAVECRVRGLFATISKAYDDAALRMPIVTARELLRAQGAHVWVVLLDRTENTSRALAALRAEFSRGELQFAAWSDLADMYNKTVALFAKQVDVVKAIIALIIVLSILNIMMMTIMERTSEIGTAMALGQRRGQLLRLFLFEGLLLGIIGGAAGIGVGFALASLISWIGIPMPPAPGMAHGYVAQIEINLPLVRSTFLLAVTTTLAASVYPAWKASRMPIVDALRQNR